MSDERLLDRWLSALEPPVRRVLVFVTGMALVLAGIALLVLPGPGLLLIIAAIALLAKEFAWAERLLRRIREQAKRSMNPLRRS